MAHIGSTFEHCIIPYYTSRMLFAVLTTATIYVYDTQHAHPLVRIAGCHCSTLNDVAWTADGTGLAVCSSDGYISFVRFKEGALGASSAVSMCL